MFRGTLLHELLHLPNYWKVVRASPDLPYPVQKIAFGDHYRQYFLIAEPAEPPSGWIIYWHGGGWQFGSPEQFQKTAHPFLDAGYGVIIPSYRRLPWNDFRTIRQDTIMALAACRNFWQSKGNPHPPVVLLGMSAGGHLASIAGLDKGILQEAGWNLAQIKGVVACGGVLDFSLMKNNPIIRLLAGHPERATFSLANPVAQMAKQTAKLPPFLLIHGTKDGMVPYEAAVSFLKCYREHSSASTCDLITMQRGTHLDAARWMFKDTLLRQTIMAKVGRWLMVDR